MGLVTPSTYDIFWVTPSDERHPMSESEIPAHNFIVNPHELHSELLDLESRTVWQSQQPITREEYSALAVPSTFRKVGIGVGVMDEHYFRRSPGMEKDGPVAEQMFEEHLFIHCANPPKGGPESPVGDNPLLMRVDKHHSLLFEEGREVDVLRLPDGRDFVQVIAAAPLGGSLLQDKDDPAVSCATHLPQGWNVRTEKLTAHTTIHLPNPTEAWFFKSGVSFQGPIEAFRTP